MSVFPINETMVMQAENKIKEATVSTFNLTLQAIGKALVYRKYQLFIPYLGTLAEAGINSSEFERFRRAFYPYMTKGAQKYGLSGMPSRRRTEPVSSIAFLRASVASLPPAIFFRKKERRTKV